MAFCASGEHFIPNLQSRRRTTPTVVKASSLLDQYSHRLLPASSSVKCNKKNHYNPFFFFCCNNPSSKSKPSPSAPKKSAKNLEQPFIKTFLEFSSANTIASIIYDHIFDDNSGIGGGGNGGAWNRGGGGGGGGGKGTNGDGGFWSRIVFFPSATIDNKELEEEDQLEKESDDDDDDDPASSSQKNQEWVVFHGGLIPANINIVFDQVLIKRLMISTGLKLGLLIKETKNVQYYLFDQYPCGKINVNNINAVGGGMISCCRDDDDDDDDDSSCLGVIEMLMPAVRSGQIYRQGQVRHQLLEALWNCGILIWFPNCEKPIWQSPESFRCINVGSLPKWETLDPELPGIWTDHRDKREYYESVERAYKMRVDKARPCLMPLAVQNEIFMKLKEAGKEVNSPCTRLHLFKMMEERVQKWYRDRSYACANVMYFGGSFCNAKEIVCEVVEGDITQLDIQFLDKLNNVCEGNTQLALIKRQLPRKLQQGHVYTEEAGKKAMANLNLLGLFSKIEVVARRNGENVGGVLVEIKLKELERNKSEVTTTWNIVPGREGLPTLASLQPSGIVTYVHRNLKGLNRSIIGSIASPNLLNPQVGDLQFQLQYVHPYLDGVNDPRDRTFCINCYPSTDRKMSPVFPGVPELHCIPPIWVGREGIKANITENFNNHQSKFMYGLVMEKITTTRIDYFDYGRHYVTDGHWEILDVHGDPLGYYYGPPTTHSGTGVDYMVFAQANITRDNTKFVNGTTVGQRTVFQVDQGLGNGSKFPFFNRHQLTHTRFLQLKQVEEGAGKPPPPVLVLHGHYGGCVGDLPGYDAFTLGGPNSVRGYSMGELGACRYMLEVAAELRIPVKNTYVYAFAEHGNDLGSSKDVRGNPTQFYRRKGQGSSYGLGVKLLDQVRAEYAIDHNEGTGAVCIQFGERF